MEVGYTYVDRCNSLACKLTSGRDLESRATPITWIPLSTYTHVPVTPDARGEQRNAAVFPTSSALQNIDRHKSLSFQNTSEVLQILT